MDVRGRVVIVTGSGRGLGLAYARALAAAGASVVVKAGLLQDKVLFGSDYPVITPDRWLADFEALDLEDTVRLKILKTDAARLLGLTPKETP